MKINKFTSIVASLMLAGAFTSVSACEVPVDIKPTSCPNPVNVDRGGVLPVAILGTEAKPVSRLDAATFILYIKNKGLNAGTNLDPAYFVRAIRTAVKNVAGPDEVPGCDLSDKEASCGTDGPDEYADLTAKFNNAKVIAMIETTLERTLVDGELICVTLQAHVPDLTPRGYHRHHGDDVIWIKKKSNK